MKLRKSLGQHVLKDKNIAWKIVAALQIGHSDSIVEIGGGTGALTEEILNKKPKTLTVIEIDRNMVNILKERFNGIRLINADASRFNISSIGKDLKITGNLPYNMSTAILENILTHRKSVRIGVFMIQKEVAERLISQKGYFPSFLSFFFRVKKLFNVSPNCFFPRPKVMSTVIELKPKDFKLCEEDFEGLKDFLKRIYAHRRKTIENNLNIRIPEFSGKRAEELSQDELFELFTKFNR